MTRLHGSLLAVSLCVAFLLASPIASASPGTVWVVDDDGGPGVDFASVQDAVLVAQSGDTIEVFSGTYPGAVTITSGITLTARAHPTAGSTVRMQGLLTVQGIPAGEHAVLNKLTPDAVHIVGCDGLVTLIDVVTWEDPSKLEDCADVRLSWCAFYRTLRIEESAAELDNCSLRGEDHYGSQGISGYDGGNGLDVGTGSQVVLNSCALEAGAGGDGSCFFGVHGGRGGDGLHVEAGSEVDLSHCTVLAGYGGEGCHYTQDGPDGVEVVNYGVLRWIDSGPPPVVVGPGSSQVGFSDSPVMSAVAYANLSGPFLQLRVWGNPGAQVTLLLSRRSADQQVAGAPDRLRVRPTATVHLGTLNQFGYLSTQWSLPSELEPGRVFYVQALVTDHAGRRLTNGPPTASF